MSGADNEKLMDTNYAAWRAQDIDGVLACFTPDCVYEDMAMGESMHGHDGLRAFVEGVYVTMPDFNVIYTKRFAGEQFGVGQWLIKATWNGEFEGVDCTGKPIEFTGISYYAFSDGKIAHAQDCWDYTQMMLGFGVLRESLRGLK